MTQTLPAALTPHPPIALPLNTPPLLSFVTPLALLARRLYSEGEAELGVSELSAQLGNYAAMISHLASGGVVYSVCLEEVGSSCTHLGCWEANQRDVIGLPAMSNTTKPKQCGSHPSNIQMCSLFAFSPSG